MNFLEFMKLTFLSKAFDSKQAIRFLDNHYIIKKERCIFASEVKRHVGPIFYHSPKIPSIHKINHKYVSSSLIYIKTNLVIESRMATE